MCYDVCEHFYVLLHDNTWTVNTAQAKISMEYFVFLTDERVLIPSIGRYRPYFKVSAPHGCYQYQTPIPRETVDWHLSFVCKNDVSTPGMKQENRQFWVNSRALLTASMNCNYLNQECSADGQH